MFEALLLILAQQPPLPLTNETSTNDHGTIVFYRTGSIMGAAGACRARYRGKEVIELGRNKYAEWKVPPGRYILTNKSDSIEVTVFPKETRYVRCKIRSGFMSSKQDLQISDKESFEEKGEHYELKLATPFADFNREEAK